MENDEIVTILQQILAELKILSSRTPAPIDGPNFRASLLDFWSYDWDAIGAKIIARDPDGPTIVDYRGETFYRRNPINNKGDAIWYSHAIGKEGDKILYSTLVMFKDSKSGRDYKPTPIPSHFPRPVRKPAAPQAAKPAAPAPSPKPTPAAIPQPAPAAAPDHDTNPGRRPMEVRNYIDGINKQYATTKISDVKRGQIGSIIERCFPNLSITQQKIARDDILIFIAGKKDISQIPDSMLIGIWQWLAPVQDERDQTVWLPGKDVKFEAERIFIMEEGKHNVG